MSSTLRKRSSVKRYKKHQKSKPEGCDFCKFTKTSDQVISEHKFFKLVKNIYGYDVWDSCGIVEQLMIVPDRHVHSISEFTKEESEEFVDLIQEYEKKGYNLYARAAQAATKSVAHQHTHLIKIDNRRKRFMVYLKKPHFLWFR